MNRKTIILLLTLLLAFPPMVAADGYRHSAGAVYVMSNDPAGNEVVVFERDFRGRLSPGNAYATGGIGTGGSINPLDSQGSLIISPTKRWLFAVNAGSNDISVFRVRRNDLELVGYYDSGGEFPVSLTLKHNLIYVLNADQNGTNPNITGFKLNSQGQLKPLAGSTRSLPGGGFHQVGFTPRGDSLIVTKGGGDSDDILVFAVDEDGMPDAAPTITPSAGLVPFGFIFDWRGHLLVSEAGSGAVSSYAIMEDNTLDVIDASVPNGNNATCWIAGTWFGIIITSNTASDNLSTYKVKAADGLLRIKDKVAATGNKPIDLATTASGRYLYVLNAADGTVSAFRVFPHGRLRDLGTTAGLPEFFAQGIAVR